MLGWPNGPAINYLTSVLVLSKWLTQVTKESIKLITYAVMASLIYSIWDVTVGVFGK